MSVDLVSRSQPITKAQLDALADYANAKTNLPGQPFAFSDNPQADPNNRWIIELRRLRSKIWDVQLDSNNNAIPDPNGPIDLSNHFDPNDVWTSGPWLLGVTGTYEPSRVSIFRGYSSKNLSSDNYYAYHSTIRVPNATDAKSVQYIFAADSISGASVKTTLSPFGISNDFERIIWGLFQPDESGLRTLEDVAEWKLKTNLPLCRCVGTLFVTFSGDGTGDLVPPDCTVTGILGQKATATLLTDFNPIVPFALKLEFDFEYSEESFEFGVKINNYNTGRGTRFEHGFLTNGSDLRFEITSLPVAEDGIDSSNPVYSISVPDCTLEHFGGELFTANPPTSRFEQWRTTGRVGTIKHEASAAIADKGVWIGKTIPMGACFPNPKLGSNFILNNSAHLGAPADPASPVKKVTPAIDFVLPAYPVRHISQAETEQGQSSIPRGSMIFKVNIASAPILVGEIYKASAANETVTIGYMRGLTFVTLQTVSFVGSAEIYPNWIILNPAMLVYQTASGNRALIQANIFAAQAITVGALAGHTVGSDKIMMTGNMNFPLVAEHFNETVQMLDAIT